MSNLKFIASILFCLVVFGFLALWVGGGLINSTLVKGEATFTIESKERIAEDGDGKWMVFATDGSEYQITDNWFFGMTDSTDRYRDLVVGRTYTCSTIGNRWGLLSWYPNLRECEEIQPSLAPGAVQ